MERDMLEVMDAIIETVSEEINVFHVEREEEREEGFAVCRKCQRLVVVEEVQDKWLGYVVGCSECSGVRRVA